jgi:hypothetical protein
LVTEYLFETSHIVLSHNQREGLLDLINHRALTLKAGDAVLHVGSSESWLPLIDACLGAREVFVTDVDPDSFTALHRFVGSRPDLERKVKFRKTSVDVASLDNHFMTGHFDSAVLWNVLSDPDMSIPAVRAFSQALNVVKNGGHLWVSQMARNKGGPLNLASAYLLSAAASAGVEVTLVEGGVLHHAFDALDDAHSEMWRVSRRGALSALLPEYQRLVGSFARAKAFRYWAGPALEEYGLLYYGAALNVLKFMNVISPAQFEALYGRVLRSASGQRPANRLLTYVGYRGAPALLGLAAFFIFRPIAPWAAGVLGLWTLILFVRRHNGANRWPAFFAGASATATVIASF